MSISLSMITLVMGLMILMLKWALLKKVSEEEAKEQEDGRMSALNMTDLYRGNDEEEGAGDGIRRVANPLHSAAMNQLRDENAQLRDQNARLGDQNARLGERLRRHGIPVDEDDGKDGKDDKDGKDGAEVEVEVEEAPTAFVLVRQQEALDADRVDAPPVTEDVSSRLAGFGQISGKRNTLDRNMNRPSPKPSMTGQTGAKSTKVPDKDENGNESEEGSVDL